MFLYNKFVICKKIPKFTASPKKREKTRRKRNKRKKKKNMRTS